MKRATRALAYLRTAMLIIALALPLLSLILLGSLWLWENGYVLYWAMGACLIVASIYAVERWLLRETVASARAATDLEEEPDPAWTVRETAAWDAVQAIANGIDPAKFNSRDAILALGTRTIDAVARQIHPGEKDPLWKFTVPEALALVERVSGELGPFVRENIPLGDRLTVGQVMAIYRWRSIIGVAEQAFDLWRIIRLMNPMSAITQEMREKVTRQIYDWGRDELARRLASAYVREVGRAAIDLYSGRLRVSPETLATTVTGATREDRAEGPVLAEPLRILILGQVNAGKSSLVNALSEEIKAAVDVLPATRGYTAYELKRDGLPGALLIDGPGLSADVAAMLELLEEADDSDLILWVSSATRPDRDTDRKGLDALRDHLAARLERRAPPILIVLTHVDQLRPSQDWNPPYDLLDKENAKAVSIGEAVQVVGAELGTPVQSVVPVCLDEKRGHYNVDVVWAKTLDVMPEAQGARLVRVLAAAGSQASWRRLWSQAVNAGRVIARTLTS
ncbi:MAG: GTPase domain-containing protein [Hyphomicrobium sp.]